jgi:hypothetical protein
MKNIIVWDITPFGSSMKNRRFGGTYLILVNLKIEAMCLTRATRRHIGKDNIIDLVAIYALGRISFDSFIQSSNSLKNALETSNLALNSFYLKSILRSQKI